MNWTAHHDNEGCKGEDWFIVVPDAAENIVNLSEDQAKTIVRAVNHDHLFDEMVTALRKAEELYLVGILNSPEGFPQEVADLRRAVLAKL